MDLNELIVELEQLRKEFGGDIPVFYMGMNSPVSRATYYNSRDSGVVAMLEGK